MRRLAVSREDVYKGPLVLVNADHPVTAPASDRLLPLEDAEDVRLDKKAASLLEQVFRTIGARRRIVPVSGFRSRNQQESLYVNSLRENGAAFTKKYVARPGCSEHETGLAVDLTEHSGAERPGAEFTGHIDILCPSFPDTGICGEFRKRAAAYGFVERYGKGKEALTGIAYEPWHFRYVGYPHSLYMEEKRLCLEEYIALLRRYPYRGEPLRFRQTEICFAGAGAAYDGLVVPEDCTQISGNNDDGFIVTVWRNGV